MSGCKWLIDDYEGCDKPCEGSTPYCGSHNRLIRKQAANSIKEQELRKSLIESQKAKRSEPRPAPNKVNPKRKVLNQEYSVLRKGWLINFPDCQIKLIGCEGKAVEIHHTESGSNKVKSLNDVSTWKSACAHCHRFLHDKLSAKEAREKGLKI